MLGILKLYKYRRLPYIKDGCLSEFLLYIKKLKIKLSLSNTTEVIYQFSKFERMRKIV